jgi:hypothetical protein
MPPHPQKTNDAGPAGLRPAGPASFVKFAPPQAAQAAEAKRENQKALLAWAKRLDKRGRQQL